MSNPPKPPTPEPQVTAYSVHRTGRTNNYNLPAFPDLIFKDSYWRWPERNLAGNAINFFVQALGLSFHDAMRQITAT